MSANEKELKPEKTQAVKRRLGFNDKGEAYPGVDPETGERVTVTLKALKDELGAKRGEEAYRQIAAVTGSVDVFNLDLERNAHDMQIAGADKDIVAKVNDILGKE